ncbi:DUF4158 domain-containing protein [Streptomyces hirsutus]|uniref:DUF4158 domain-containing protein n=1 Tax=Streptomyces hirsutus TaxID=35620 RepID=UPI00362A3853
MSLVVMLSVVWGLGWVVTSIERTAYPRFKRLITAHELHLFFSPSRDELEWAADATDCDEHLLALLLILKSYRHMGCFPALEDVPEMVVEFVRRAVELPEGTLPVYRAERTAKHHRGLVRKQAGVTYDQVKARGIVEQSIRKEAAAKNRPADLINIALEKVVEAGLELPGFSTFDKMASKIRTEVNASICAGTHDRMSAAQRAGLMRLLEDRDSDGTTLFNRLKKPAKGPTWSHFKNLTKRLEWLDELGDTDVWMGGRRGEDHRLRRRGGRGGRLGAAGLRPSQTHRAGRRPDTQGENASAGRPRDDVLQACGDEDQEGQGGAGGDPARRAGDRRVPDRELPHGAQARRRGRPGPGGAHEGGGHDRRGPQGPGWSGRGGVG